ncbi:valyl tRNA synthetase [Tieghemostelium lacteum]|uniref:Valine--tRNA ligase, mitochondrial n=1 Tax=Tieghemostelium lacteum TaxID=361077 RepID=G8FUG3_TIELA|nr:valyl tRNA synthetase [Tieghemostelium lacteum]KYQ93821.1 valyl tRNA synthetase [Tieghemostelium lacteum]|eukprot:KYQ93821.1 valyl tRNA synthetase [Tieghemostelium lacteum]
MEDKSKTTTTAPPPKELDEEQKKKLEEKKKAKEEEKKLKAAKFAEKEAKQKAEREKEAENKAKKERERLEKEAEEKEKQLQEQIKLKQYLDVILKTPSGQKKDLGGQGIFPNYHPTAVESIWYDYWMSNGYFSPEAQMKIQKHVKPDQKFTIVIPPPNVTGSLHLGHALGGSIQDALIRYRRMNGEVALWVPGTDHAGIATQVVVEKKIWKEEKKTRHDIGREDFVKKVWDWKNEYGSKIQGQLKKMGCSLDWNREVFTMDQTRSQAVNECFIRMFNDGLISRSTRLVNWSCALKTAISDIEVEFKDLEKHTKLKVPGHQGEYDFGVMFEFSYPVEGTDQYLNVATTRIETMLADTAVAINSKDERYKQFHGKYIIHPLNGRRIPIIIDDDLVILGFGTGAVKVTPAHDPNDYECGQRKNLAMINLFTDEGLINENGGERFKGLKRFDARNEVIKALQEKGLYRGMTDNKMRIGVCSRSKDIIEPMIKPQWYVKCDGMAERACKAVKDGELKIIPEAHEATWFRWLESIKDWCVSRQLWWGHRIPAYHVAVKGINSNPYDTTQWVVGSSLENAIENAIKKYNLTSRDQIESIEQDPDVLDTWFSSGLFPFSVFGWPQQTEDLKSFYPTSVLETGADILFFWVARMVMMGQYLTDKLPFHTVFLHSLVRDAHGRKMSKSLGNVLDPNDVIRGITKEELIQKLYEGNLDPSEIERATNGIKADFPQGILECGTDAMRFALCAYTSQTRDINLDINRVVSYRHFCNKIWNATRFALMKLEGYKPLSFSADSLTKDTNAINLWMLNAAQRAINLCIEGFKSYDFSQVTTAIYNYWLLELCDVYLETTKPIFQSQDESDQAIKEKTKETLYTCIDIGLRLIHPFMPYISEELYQVIPRRPEEQWIPTIMYAPYPQSTPQWANGHIEEEMKECREVIHAIRSLRITYNVPPQKRISSYIQVKTQERFEMYSKHSKFIQGLSYSQSTAVLLEKDTPSSYIGNQASDSATVLFDSKDLKDDFDFSKEITRLQAKSNEVNTKKEQLLKKINIPDYSKVPAKVQQDNEQKLKSFNDELAGLIKSIESLNSLI